jgi:hypothetical protein
VNGLSQAQIDTTETAHQTPECFGKQSSPFSSTIFHREMASHGSTGARNLTLIDTDFPDSVAGIVTLVRAGLMPGEMSSTNTRLPPCTAHRAVTSSESTQRNWRPT